MTSSRPDPPETPRPAEDGERARGSLSGTTANDDRLDREALDLLRAVATRVEIGRRLVGESTEAVLRTIVEAAAALFGAEAASLALYDPATDRLVIRVAAGEQGVRGVGLSIPPSTGLVGYVFTTGQAIAQSDVAHDDRFGRDVAESTGYTPHSLVAVPLVDEHGTIGVLEVLDKCDCATFSIRDIELASIFAHQAAVAISASRVERDAASLLSAALHALAVPSAGDAAPSGGDDGTRDITDRIAAAAVAELDTEDDCFWALVEQVGRVRFADPGQLALITDLLAVVARHAVAGRHRTARGGPR